jgi:hypothetical protein
MKKHIKYWEIIGILFIVVFGASLHFVFKWTNYWRPAALIAAVNESTWEHFKIAFWPSMIWAIIEYQFIRKEANNFAIAKATGFLLMPIVTAILFYGYNAITRQHYLILDIIIFIISAITGQFTSMQLMLRDKIKINWLRKMAIGILLLMTIAFSSLSYFPLKNFLFAHPHNGEFGILSEYDHSGNDH